MKKLILFLLLASPLFGQSGHIEVNKTPGDPTTIWFWSIPAQTAFDGISIESSISLAGPFTDVALTIDKTVTSVTFPAPAVPTFYRWYLWKVVNGVKTKSVPSNVVAISITLTGIPVATGS